MSNDMQCRSAVRFRKSEQATLRLLCFPHAGASASMFKPYADALPPAIAVIGVQPPGRETRYDTAPFVRIDALVADLAADLMPIVEGRFVLCGISMGATVAYELAHYWRDRGGPSPEALLVIARAAPGVAKARPMTHHLPEPEFLAELQRIGGTNAEIMADPELRNFVLPILRADFEACETYHPPQRAALSCPILAVGGERDGEASVAEIDAWAGHTTARFERVLLPGGHFFFRTEQIALLEIIRTYVRDLLE